MTQQNYEIYSVSFSSHNNGKADKTEVKTDSKKETEPKEKKRKRDDSVKVENNLSKIKSESLDDLKTNQRKSSETSTSKESDEFIGETFHVDVNLEVRGNLKAKQFFQYSDIKLKTNIEDIADAVNIISKLEGKKILLEK